MSRLSSQSNVSLPLWLSLKATTSYNSSKENWSLTSDSLAHIFPTMEWSRFSLIFGEKLHLRSLKPADKFNFSLSISMHSSLWRGMDRKTVTIDTRIKSFQRHLLDFSYTARHVVGCDSLSKTNLTQLFTKAKIVEFLIRVNPNDLAELIHKDKR